MVEFAKFTPEEQEHVDRIVNRALPLFAYGGVAKSHRDIEMDLAATHAQIPLCLADLADASDFEFGHDITGIHLHLNRKTGELEGYFVPRHAQEG